MFTTNSISSVLGRYESRLSTIYDSLNSKSDLTIDNAEYVSLLNELEDSVTSLERASSSIYSELLQLKGIVQNLSV